jgi:osmotically inducible lipoprotein OsmB
MSPSRVKASVCGFLAAASLTIVAARPVHAEGAFGLNTTATNALGGGAIGAGAGALIGHQKHHTAAGAAIGGGLGVVAGGLVGHQIQQGEERSAAQQSQINRQQREINRLKLQQQQQQQQATHTDDRY